MSINVKSVRSGVSLVKKNFLESLHRAEFAPAAGMAAQQMDTALLGIPFIAILIIFLIFVGAVGIIKILYQPQVGKILSALGAAYGQCVQPVA